MRTDGTSSTGTRRARTTTWAAVALAAGLLATGCGPASTDQGAAEPAVPAAASAAAPGAAAAAAPAVDVEPLSQAVAEAPATAEPAVQSSAQPAAEPTAAAAPAPLRQGARGEQVLALQQRLSDLGYWLGTPDGSFGALTTQAVYALQGAAGLGRDGVVGSATQAALDAGTRPTASTTSGHAVEIDRERGLVLFVDDGVVGMVLHTSTGTFVRYTHDGRSYLADTPEGTFTTSRAVAGWRDGDLGRLYAPRYFHPDGIALHGYGSVPAHPASHGCARVSLPAMDVVWARDLMPIGGTVVVR